MATPGQLLPAARCPPRFMATSNDPRRLLSPASPIDLVPHASITYQRTAQLKLSLITPDSFSILKGARAISVIDAATGGLKIFLVS